MYSSSFRLRLLQCNERWLLCFIINSLIFSLLSLTWWLFSWLCPLSLVIFVFFMANGILLRLLLCAGDGCRTNFGIQTQYWKHWPIINKSIEMDWKLQRNSRQVSQLNFRINGTMKMKVKQWKGRKSDRKFAAVK